ncbi:esterase-like activity of phytase family protein [Zavarzinia compransoris]|uniref:Phytase-like domain-containing protein n=1 Tax=Zavarzinia compransoris TaxID=1264899 RepID=A0A317DZA1_9PROT|nr:esterase-like activity of phytase family protein [Zavarzinia compransoris]PWR19752.1 hypothetical protein DKG75_14915 [Zavarzinia compransoris]TDP45147.1 hypothetical protein DES42_106370 [Zavarzinia compransoris]
MPRAPWTGLAAAFAAVLLSAPALALAGQDIGIEAYPIPLAPENPEQRQLGELAFAGGLQLSSPDRRFGGWSGMVVTADGTGLTAVSDNGWYLTARLGRRDGRLATVDGAEIGPLAGENGQPLAGDKVLADAESLALLADGTLAVGFERAHRILLYPPRPGGSPLAGTPRPLPTPPALQRAPANGGLEALLALPDGRLLGFAEDLYDDAGALTGWLFPGPGGGGPVQALALVATEDYQPTDIAALPGGDILLLQRRFTVATGPGARLSVIPAAALGAGRPIRDRELARITPPLNVDNFECLGLWIDGAGRTRALILSDDNNDVLQRTLLLEFLLP